MEMRPSLVCRMFSAPLDSEGYHTRYPSDDARAEPAFPAGRLHTALNFSSHDGRGWSYRPSLANL